MTETNGSELESPEFEPADMLPGLEDPERREPRLKLAARRSIRALEEAGYLDERHAVVCQLILDLADVIASSTRAGKAAAAGMASAQILAAYQLLIPEVGGGGDNDAWREFQAEVRRGSPEIRDSV